jgi:hypothetical protein
MKPWKLVLAASLGLNGGLRLNDAERKQVKLAEDE